jgi:hypothetical protein
MNNYTIKIKGKKAYIDSGFNLSLTYDSLDLINPINRSVGFTYSINIPKCKANNEIFGFINDDLVINKFKASQYDIVVELNNSILISGIFYLDTINDTSYVGSIVSDNLNWVKNIGDININKMTGYTMNFPLITEKIGTFDTLNTYKTLTSDQTDIAFPFITRQNYNFGYYSQQLNSIISPETSPFPYSAATKLNYFDIPPSYYYKNSLENVFNYFNLNVECSLFGDPEFKKLVIPYVSSDLPVWNYRRLLRFNATASTITENYAGLGTNFQYTTDIGYKYVVDKDGYYTINIIPTGSTYNMWLYQSSVAEPVPGELKKFIWNISGSQFGTALTYTQYFQRNDIMYAVSNNGVNLSCISSITITYNDGDELLNYQQFLPPIKAIDWIKNFLNYYALYPYYNAFNNTVYLYTLDEFVRKENDFKLNGIDDVVVSLYNFANINLKYTFDSDDPLISENQYDYLSGSKDAKDIQLLFAPTGTRSFILSQSGTPYTTNSNVILPSIASRDLINLDRITYNLTDTLDYTDWSPSTAYTAGDQVKYNGLFYSAVYDNTNQNPRFTNYWVEDFLGDYNTDVSFNSVARILKIDNSNTSIYVTSSSGEKYFYQTAFFDTETQDLDYVFLNRYKTNKAFFNNNTSIIEGSAYIPVYKFIKFFNRPVEIKYKNDVYILLGISQYNPLTEKGKVKLIRKVVYMDYVE